MTFSFDLESAGIDEIHLALVIDDEIVWPHPGKDDGGSNFDPEDVVSYLTDAWASLLLSQSWPTIFEADQDPRSMTGLLRAAEDRWQQLGVSESAIVESEARSIDTFLYAHDLSQMKYGAGLGHCFIIRQNSWVRIETNAQVYEKIPFRRFVEELTRLGSLAAETLRQRGDRISLQLLKRWERREKVDPIRVAAFLSGLSELEIQRSTEVKSTLVTKLANRKISTVANDNGNPVYAAARSSGPLGPASVGEILRQIETISSGDITEILAINVCLKRCIRGIERPTDQGIRAASFVRDWLTLRDDEPVDLERLSERLGIFVDRKSIMDSRLDGIATFGPAHGPSIILNENTRRYGAGTGDLERSLRFTWSHEIGHLLLDRDDWPALVDAVKQRVPRSVETRANAFAAYLLLPQATAYRLWEQRESPLEWPELEAFLNHLTLTFGLPRIVASRQLTRDAPPERRGRLEQVLRMWIANFDGLSPEIR